jgi:hypothetical protein
VRFLIPLVAVMFALAGCHAKSNAPGEAPSGVTATPGDGLVVISWNVVPDLTYWIFFAPGDSVSVGAPGSLAIRRALDPRVVPGLANGTEYAFVMNATNNDSAAGPTSAPVTAIPQLAGSTWVPSPGSPLGTQNLNAMAFNGSRFVVVGDAGTIFAGDLAYTSTDPQGVNVWTPPTTPPTPAFSENLTAVMNNGTFIALGTNGAVISSADGFNWSANQTIPGASGMTGLVSGFVGGATVQTFVAVGSAGKIFFTTDLANWIPATSNTTSDLTGISVVNGTSGFFVATGTGGTLLTSQDAQNWSVNTTNTTSTLRGFTFGPSLQSPTTGVLYIAVGDAGTIITTPQLDSPVWTPINPAPTTQSLRSVTLGGAAGTRFLAVGQGGAVVYSDDGFNWIPASSGFNLARAIFGGGLYLGVGDAGANAVSRQ